MSSGPGWRLQGTAVFRDATGEAQLRYEVNADRYWRTSDGRVDGWIGDQSVRASVQRTGSGWELNGAVIQEVSSCIDLDLGFTPATNVLQLRRIALEVGETADVPVAWLDLPSGGLEVLEQHYEKRSGTTYWYEAPRFAYAAELEVNESGFPSFYPGLWVAE